MAIELSRWLSRRKKTPVSSGLEGAKELGVLWGIRIPYIFPIQCGAGWSYLEFPNHPRQALGQKRLVTW